MRNKHHSLGSDDNGALTRQFFTFEKRGDLIVGERKEFGAQLAYRGELKEAEKLWDFCLREADSTNVPNAAADCANTALDALIWLKPSHEWNTWVQNLEKTLLQPGMHPSLRQFYSTRLLWTKTSIHLDKGEIDKAKAILERVKSLSESEIPFGYRSWVLRIITVEMLIRAQNYETAYQTMETQRKYVLSQNPKIPCSILFTEARIANAAGDTEKAEKKLTAILNSGCRAGESGPLLMSRILLAGALFKAGQKEQVRDLLHEFTKEWPRADEDLMLVQTAKALGQGL